MKTLLQILPRAPGSREGVGDYAGILGAELERAHGYRTEFVTAATLAGADWRPPSFDAVVLHYVNYGYHPRGVPSWLPKKLAQLQAGGGHRLVTIFHELFASSSWRGSAFWLQPLQKRIARAIAERSAVGIVSSAALAVALRQLAPATCIVVRPVVSTFGEPILSPEEVAGRDPQRWVICGGTELIRRSLRSFPDTGELFVVGGADSPEIRGQLDAAHYLPDVPAVTASAILSQSAFGWIDYFETVDVPMAAVLKSTTFAAYCAHGVIPVFPAATSTIAEGLPGPFTVANLPSASERPVIARAIYEWYRAHASSAQLAATVAEALAS